MNEYICGHILILSSYKLWNYAKHNRGNVGEKPSGNIPGRWQKPLGTNQKSYSHFLNKPSPEELKKVPAKKKRKPLPVKPFFILMPTLSRLNSQFISFEQCLVMLFFCGRVFYPLQQRNEQKSKADNSCSEKRKVYSDSLGLS